MVCPRCSNSAHIREVDRGDLFDAQALDRRQRLDNDAKGKAGPLLHLESESRHIVARGRYTGFAASWYALFV